MAEIEMESRNPKISMYIFNIQLTFLHYFSSAILPTQVLFELMTGTAYGTVNFIDFPTIM